MSLPKEQECPYCNVTEDDTYANWNDDNDGWVECSSCEKKYYAMPQYHFLGFEVEKKCETCGERESECFCDDKEDDDL